MKDSSIVLSDKWTLGPPTPSFLLRPPEGKWIWCEGTDARSGQPVGICLLRQPWNRVPGVRNAYRYGMDQIAELAHPNILKVMDIIDDEQAFGLVTERLSGDDLHRLITRSASTFSEAQIIRILRQVAAALEHAEKRGVVFDNLKPTNVLLASDGTVRVGALPRPPFQFTTFLDAGAYLTNVGYCAPELLRCEALDQRTAIYGLGITAYEMIVSKIPSPRTENLATELESIATEELPSPAKLVEGINPQLTEIIVRCLQKDRLHRYNSAAEVCRALKKLQGRNIPLISQERVREIVEASFPTPLAVLARSLVREDHLLAQRDKLLNLTNGLVGYLGFLAASTPGSSPGEELRHPSLGHWVKLIRRTFRNPKIGWPFSELREVIPNQADLLRTLDEVVRLRNEVSHGAIPDADALHSWVMKSAACVRNLYTNLLGVAGFSLLTVEDLDYPGDGLFQLTVRRLEGASGESQSIQINRPEPYKKDRVYFAPGDLSRLHSLHPWVIFAKCPLCSRRELFFYVSTDGQDVRYVTPDRGHGLSCNGSRGFEMLFDAAS